MLQSQTFATVQGNGVLAATTRQLCVRVSLSYVLCQPREHVPMMSVMLAFAFIRTRMLGLYILLACGDACINLSRVVLQWRADALTGKPTRCKGSSHVC